MNEINQKMDEEIARRLDELKTMPAGSDEQTAAVENLATLYRVKNEGDKVQVEAQKNESDRKDRMIDRIFHVGTVIVETGLTAICYERWFKAGLEFEKTGTIVASMNRNLVGTISKFFKTKR